jgi:glycosyltransferase involved in cell wall biosynthesis
MEPLGQSQFLAYQEIVAENRLVILMTFEKSEDWNNSIEKETLQKRVHKANIVWKALRYHKRFSVLATAYDVLCGIIAGSLLLRRHKARTVYARSFIPAVIGLMLKRIWGVSLVFDTRGFWVDERVDGGIWPERGVLFKVGKRIERLILSNADYVVAQTKAAINEMKTFSYLRDKAPLFVHINNCADLDLFRADNRARTGRPFTLGYVGSVGVWYRFDDSLRSFLVLKDRIPDARMHIVNRGGHDYIKQRLAEFGIDEKSIILESANHAGVARAMREMDAGVFFIKQAYSKIASALPSWGSSWDAAFRAWAIPKWATWLQFWKETALASL